MAYIEIVGVMGTGKTALAQVFNEKAQVAHIRETEEDLKRMFLLEKYISNPSKFAFEGNINFLSFHLNRIQEELHKLPEGADVVVDSSLLMQYAYAKGVMSERELNVISDIIDIAHEKLPKVDLRIVLTLPPDIHMDRILKRGREFESGVSREFIETVQKHLEEAVQKFGSDVPTIYLDASKLDWANNDNDKEKVMRIVRRKLAGLKAA